MEDKKLNSKQAIDMGFIPYPYTFPAIKFVVIEDIKAVNTKQREAKL
tara:strand:+ start:986 stop:1126 length:141 start_codon:yes stop_codon:yes gene_type:complete